MIDELLEFMRAAGDIARGTQNHLDMSHNFLKEDKVTSDVTQTDLEISRLFKSFVERRFADLDYVIVDEESIKTLGDDPLQTMAKSEYQFIIDPIDGTLPYSCAQALYGISVGVFRYGKPYLGVLYMPATHEIVYYDGNKVHLLRQAFQPEEEDVEVNAVPCRNCPMIFGHPWNTPLTPDYDMSQFVFVDYYSAVVKLLYLATHRARAYTCHMSLWDMAAGWTICNAVGIKLYHFQSGREITEVKAEDFDNNLRLKDVYIFCAPEDLPEMQKMMSVAPKLR